MSEDSHNATGLLQVSLQSDDRQLGLRSKVIVPVSTVAEQRSMFGVRALFGTDVSYSIVLDRIDERIERMEFPGAFKA